MAACGSLQHIFDKPLPLKKHLESLEEESLCFGDDSSSSLSSPLSSSSLSPSSFSSSSPFSSSPFPLDFDPPKSNFQTRRHYHSDTFVSMSSESLSMCTENLGLESCQDIETSSINNDSKKPQVVSRRNNIIRHKSNEFLYDSKHTYKGYVYDKEPKISRITGEEIPPPISSCIGITGKPYVCYKSFRNNGRFVLKKVRVPCQELLHSRREDGRLKLQFIQSDEETVDELDDAEEDKQRL